MKKLSLLALAVLALIIYSCMQDYPNEPPTGYLKITNPYSDDTFAVGDTVLIQADAVMMNLSRIDFYVDGVLKGSDSNKPYTCEWITSGFSASKHEVKAVSFSADGSLTQSLDVKLINGIAPELSISEPADNSSFKIGTVLNIFALASDADGTVSDVTFYINDILHSTLTTTPYKATWNTTGYSEGSYIVKVVAKDNMKIVTTKQIAINLYLKLPECLLTYPLNNAVYLYGQTVKIKSKATENKKSITKLNFFVDNVLIHSSTTPDSGSYYFYNWSTQNQTTKNHQLRAVAVDHNGKESTSNIVNVILNKAPTANITSPVTSSNVALNAIVPVAVTATDSDGTISEVKFLVDGVEKTVDNSAPYIYDWLATSSGNHKIKAVVKDNDGTVTESAEINVIVHNPTLATVTTTAVTDVTTTTAKSGGTVTSDEYSPISARGVCWSTSGLPSANGSHTTDGSGNGIFVSDITSLTPGTRYIIRAFATNVAGISYGDTISIRTIPLPWTRKADYTNGSAYSFAFSIGNLGYVGHGQNSAMAYYFREYNPSTNSWIEKQTINDMLTGSIGFSIGNYGYTWSAASVEYNRLWEYNTNNNSWTQKSNYPGVVRTEAIVFTIGSKAYVGLGSGYDPKGIWEYDGSTNAWTRKADFPGEKKSGSVAFVIGNKGYVVAGYPNGEETWEYDPNNDSWTRKADFSTLFRQQAVAFTINNKAYVGLGIDGSNTVFYKDLWEYDPIADNWTRKSDFIGEGRSSGAWFSINNKGYFGTGYKNGVYLSDFWEYDPTYDQPVKHK